MEEFELTITDQRGQKYDLIKAYIDERGNVKFYLYENRKTKVKECFSPVDIKILKRLR